MIFEEYSSNIKPTRKNIFLYKMDASDILQEILNLKERLENGLRRANDEYDFTVNEHATKLYRFYDENIDDAMVAYNYY